MTKKALARKNACGNSQTLYEHAENVANISVSNSQFKSISKLLAYLHDLGKLSDDFQNYIINGGERGSVIHSWQGAFLANELFQNISAADLLLKEIIAFCTTAHHNYLTNGLSTDGTADLFAKICDVENEKYSFKNIKSKLTTDEKLALISIFNDAEKELSSLLEKINGVYSDRNSANFALGLVVKYLYSCLIDADRLDAYLFDNKEQFVPSKPKWDDLIGIFEKNISNFSSTEKIDKIRNAVSEKCKAAAEKETGIYQLSVPTGGGKTLSSLRFALHHCKEKEKKRIIYVIPYLSITEQTAKSIRSILSLSEDNNVVFEHHSNIIEPLDEKESEIRKLSASRWDSPIIITTMVQFLESVMSSKGGKLRKFSHMADSVIIFDEVQSAPIKTIHCFNEVVSFLSKILNSTIILCSATQPTLEHTQRKNLLISETPNLIHCKEDFKDIKRTSVSPLLKKDISGASDFIVKKAESNGNCLVIVNTKNSALQIFSLIKEKNTSFKVFHLSTSMCPMHRMEIIEDIRKGLDENKKIICISTQLIEAGVDISFSCVIRSTAGLDSIAQAAGRCNRNGESALPKTVYTFELEDENLEKLPDIKSGKETTLDILLCADNNIDLLGEETMDLFYKKYFSGKSSQMDYPAGKYDTTVYSMLSSNNYGRQNYQKNTGNNFPHFIAQAFHSASRSFSVIEKSTVPVVVFHGNSDDLIEKYKKQPTEFVTKEKIKILKDLQKYSVQLYDWQIRKLSQEQSLTILDEQSGIILLDEKYYSKESGVVLEILPNSLIV